MPNSRPVGSISCPVTQTFFSSLCECAHTLIPTLTQKQSSFWKNLSYISKRFRKCVNASVLDPPASHPHTHSHVIHLESIFEDILLHHGLLYFCRQVSGQSAINTGITTHISTRTKGRCALEILSRKGTQPFRVYQTGSALLSASLPEGLVKYYINSDGILPQEGRKERIPNWKGPERSSRHSRRGS